MARAHNVRNSLIILAAWLISRLANNYQVKSVIWWHDDDNDDDGDGDDDAYMDVIIIIVVVIIT